MGCYLTEGAQDYIDRLDRGPVTYDYKCECCGNGFDSGYGVRIDIEYFCCDCDNEQEPIYKFYRECGLTEGEILALIQEYKKPI